MLLIDKALFDFITRAYYNMTMAHHDKRQTRYDIDAITKAFSDAASQQVPHDLSSVNLETCPRLFVVQVLFDLKMNATTLSTLRQKGMYDNITDEQVDALNNAVELFRAAAYVKTTIICMQTLIISKDQKLNDKYLTLVLSYLKTGGTKIEKLKGEEDELRAMQILQDALTDESLCAETAERMSSLVERKAKIRDLQQNTKRIDDMIQIFLDSADLSDDDKKKLTALVSHYKK
jgi:hypothetical protein